MTSENSPLARMLGDLAAEGATGRLTVTAGDTERALFLREGFLVQATSRVAEETLGRILLDQGVISSDDLDAVLQEARAGKGQIGALLIARGVIEPAEVVEALTEQIRIRVFNALRTREARSRFEPDVEAPKHFHVKLTIPELVFDAVDQVFSVDRVMDELDLDEAARLSLVRGERPTVEWLGLSARDARVLKTIGDGVTLEDLVGKVDVSYLHLIRLTYGLWALRVIEIGAAVLTDDEAPAAPPEPETPGDGAGAAASDGSRVLLDVDDSLDPTKVARRRRLLDRFKQVSRPPTPTPLPKDEGKRATGGEQGGGIQSEILRAYLELPRKSYFEVLGVKKSCGPSDVKIGYGGLLRRLHLEAPPDDWPERVKRAAKVLLDRATEAYTVLSDSQKRADYEKQLRAGGPGRVDEADPLLVTGIALHKAERLRGRGNLEEAARVLREALGEVGKQASLSLALGVTLYEWTVQGAPQADEAARRLAEAVQQDPGLDRGWFFLGRLARHQGQPELARKMLLKALLVNPSSPAAAELKSLGHEGKKPKLLEKLFGKGR